MSCRKRGARSGSAATSPATSSPRTSTSRTAHRSRFTCSCAIAAEQAPRTCTNPKLLRDVEPLRRRRVSLPDREERLPGRRLSIRSRFVLHDVANRDAEVAAASHNRFLRSPVHRAAVGRRTATDAVTDLLVAYQERDDVRSAEVDRLRIAVLFERGA